LKDPSIKMYFNVGKWESIALAGAVGAGFVGSLYTWHALGYKHDSRDNVTVIKQRMLSSGVYSLVVAPIALSFYFNLSLTQVFELLRPKLMIHFSSLYALLHVAILWIGPISWEIYKLWKYGWSKQNHYNSEEQKSLILLRNLLVGPILEEVTYRGIIARVVVSGGWSYWMTSIISPLIFGISHLHHIIDHVKSCGLTLSQAVATVTLQLGYTTLFGWYVSMVFLLTRDIKVVIFLHCFCNWMGLPTLAWLQHKNFFLRTAMMFLFCGGLFGFGWTFSTLLDPSIYPKP